MHIRAGLVLSQSSRLWHLQYSVARQVSVLEGTQAISYTCFKGESTAHHSTLNSPFSEAHSWHAQTKTKTENEDSEALFTTHHNETRPSSSSSPKQAQNEPCAFAKGLLEAEQTTHRSIRPICCIEVGNRDGMKKSEAHGVMSVCSWSRSWRQISGSKDIRFVDVEIHRPYANVWGIWDSFNAKWHTSRNRSRLRLVMECREAENIEVVMIAFRKPTQRKKHVVHSPLFWEMLPPDKRANDSTSGTQEKTCIQS